MRRRRRRHRLSFLSCLLTVCLSGPAAGAAPAAADRTDEAFGRLLAMPGAQPSGGGWIIPTEAARDEQDLIAHWQRLLKAGAEVNAMRHRGTLLAHAIRAGQERAAIWLLAHGADPRTVLADGRTSAHDLARQYQRAAVVRVLETKHGFAPAAAPAAPVTPAPSSQAAAPQTRVQQVQAQLQRLVGPVLQPDEAAQQAWQRLSATLDADEFRAVFADGAYLQHLVLLTRPLDGALEAALARLPLPLVQAHAQAIAGWLAEWSYVRYGPGPGQITYTGASRSWPALWKRLDRPLRYDMRPDLAERIPPALWPALFASGYAQRDAEVTGRVLAAIDAPGLKALWPDFRRLFPNALEAAPALVLAPWRMGHDVTPFPYASTEAETAAKLAFLRTQGAAGPVDGLREPDPAEPVPPAVAEMLAAYTPKGRRTPRLVAQAPACELALGEAWLDVLVHRREVGWGTPADTVARVEVPGQRACGLVIGGDSFPDLRYTIDEFASGPFRDPPTPSCADAPDDAEIWLPGPQGIRRVAVGAETRGIGLASLRLVRDVQTGKRYAMTNGQVGPLCAQSNQLPEAFEWLDPDGTPRLERSADQALLDTLLRRQCRGSLHHRDVSCPDLDLPLPPEQAPVLERLRGGAPVPLQQLLDAIGGERRAAYRAALAARDHAQLRRLLARGIPAAWTAAEIQALAAAGMPLPDKRRRLALLFANAEQLSLAMAAGGREFAQPLGRWLPREDAGPLLRIIGKAPEAWYEFARSLRAGAQA